MNNRLLRPKELAKKLSISIPTLYRMIQRNELPPKVQISSRAVGWKESDINEWIDEKADKKAKPIV